MDGTWIFFFYIGIDLLPCAKVFTVLAKSWSGEELETKKTHSNQHTRHSFCL